MFIKSIGSHRINNLSFERRLTPKEEKDYKENAIQPALDYLGTQEVAMILHGTCYPQAQNDIGVGSPYGKVAAQLIPFEILHGFNSNQLGPVGAISNAQQISPYKSTVSTRNYLFLDFSELTKDKYANILSTKTINEVFNQPQNSDKNYAYSKFNDAFANYDYCIKIANNNFKQKVKEKDPTALKLNKEFSIFKQKKGDDLRNEALFNILSKDYATEDFTKWNKEDRDLISNLNQGDKDATDRFERIIKRSQDKYESFILGQFLLDKQIKENTHFRNLVDFKYINDLLVGFSKADEWAHQDLFLKDWRMGCPYGGEYGPQLWDIPVLNPQKLFTSETDLGPAGIYLKEKFENALQDFDNIRIDHALGLIDPYIYDKNSVCISNDKIDMEKFKGNNISNMPELDPYGDFKRVLNNIIIPSLEEHGINRNAPIWEDLCTETPVFNEIYHTNNNLPGITQLEYRRAENSQRDDNWSLVGSHDSPPATQMIKKDWIRNNDGWNIFYLAGFLNSNPKRAKYRDEFCRKIDNNDNERVKAKFAELFLTSKKIQISFADFFGINKVYNKAGEENDINWKLRLNKDYEDTYYKNLSSDNPTALNMPEILKMAVQAKSDRNIAQMAKEEGLALENIPEDNPPHVQNIINNLDKYEQILKEKE